MTGELVPTSESELAEMVRAAAAAGEGLAVRGGGTRGIGGAVTGRPVSLAAIAGITLYEPGALTLVARAGTPLEEVEAVLAAEGQRLAFEPWDGRAMTGANGVPTVGGLAATNASGPRRIEVGAARDSMIGVRFVDGTGAVVQNGGRVMKNVTGLDLVKLLAGSHGTLGILTEVSFKVLPAATETATLIFEGHDLETAGRTMRASLATPYGVSGAAHLGGRTLLRIEGFPASVAHRTSALAAALARHGAARIEPGPGEWAAIRDVAAFAGRPGALWRISVRPSDGPDVAARLAPAEVMLDWAGGLVWALAPEEMDVRARVQVAGHATLMRGSEPAKARWGVFPPEAAPVAALSAGLRARFDPKGILNPGLMAAPAGVAA
jgi:glycolate oxidase FAD binding subunit